jgi:hypothetical protein
MSESVKQFLLKSLLFTAILNLLAFIFLYIYTKQLLSLSFSVFFIFSIFFYLSTGIFFHYTIKLSTTNPSKFVNGYMFLSIAKLLAYLVIIVLIVLLFRNHSKILLITYLINYLAYTIQEVVYVVKSLKKIQNS